MTVGGAVGISLRCAWDTLYYQKKKKNCLPSGDPSGIKILNSEVVFGIEWIIGVLWVIVGIQMG